MARFLYNGEPPRSYVITYGPTLIIKIPKKDGTIMVLNAPNPQTGFVIGDDIGTNITDERSLRVMRSDTRYTEIV